LYVYSPCSCDGWKLFKIQISPPGRFCDYIGQTYRLITTVCLFVCFTLVGRVLFSRSSSGILKKRRIRVSLSVIRDGRPFSRESDYDASSSIIITVEIPFSVHQKRFSRTRWQRQRPFGETMHTGHAATRVWTSSARLPTAEEDKCRWLVCVCVYMCVCV